MKIDIRISDAPRELAESLKKDPTLKALGATIEIVARRGRKKGKLKKK